MSSTKGWSEHYYCITNFLLLKINFRIMLGVTFFPVCLTFDDIVLLEPVLPFPEQSHFSKKKNILDSCSFVPDTGPIPILFWSTQFKVINIRVTIFAKS